MYNKKQSGPRSKRKIVRKQRNTFFRKKVCRLCGEKAKDVDYKDIGLLQKFVTERGKIVSPKISGACHRHQKKIRLAIKRARAIALLPFMAR